ncbi:MAG: CotH kinase family protein [Bacteroidia bacterium]|nr:CotH kinase family protein [Bacteroidia bacterium]
MTRSTSAFLLLWLCFPFYNLLGQGEQIFDDAIVHEIQLSFSDSDFWTTLSDNYENNYPNIPYIMANAVIDGEILDSIGVRLKGFSSTFIATPKKSIKLDFNEYVSGKKYDGLKKINLNNGEGDPAILRDKLCYDILRNSGVKVPRTAYAKVYLNGTYWGLYLLVEQIDRTFLDENFGTDEGNLFKNMGNSDLSWQGRDTSLYQQEFELKTPARAGAWNRFVNLLDVLNNSSDQDFKDAIAQVFDVELYLKVLAVDVATSNWDSYIEHGRNFYMYENPNSGKFQWIPWDYNLAMGGTFSSAGEDPNPPDSLRKDSLAVSQCPTVINGSVPYPPEDTILQEVMSLDEACCYIGWDGICQDLYTRLSNGDTLGGGGGFPFGYPTFPVNMDTSSKVLINRLLAVPEYNEIYYQTWCRLLEDNFTTERLFPIIDTIGNLIRPHIQTDVNYPWSLQNFEGDLDQGNDTIPGLKRFIGSRIAEHSMQLGNLYDCSQLNSSLSFREVVINEFCASCDSLSGLADANGEYDDWIEIYNTTSSEVDLSHAYLSDNISNPQKWAFPAGTRLGPHAYMIIWADNDEGQEGLHANFKLSKAGESIILMDNNTILDSLSYEAQSSNQTFARKPNGSGNFLAGSPTFKATNDWVTGIGERWPEEMRLSVFPNPAHDRLNVNFEDQLLAGTQAFLLNMMGQEIMRKELKEIENSFYLGELALGMYLLRIENRNRQVYLIKRIEIN